MEELEGVYVNPKNTNKWSSKPYPEQQRFIYMKNKTCPLSRSVREYVLSHYDAEGNFIINEE